MGFIDVFETFTSDFESFDLVIDKQIFYSLHFCQSIILHEVLNLVFDHI